MPIFDGTQLKVTKKHFLYVLLFNTLIALALCGREDMRSARTFFSNLAFSQVVAIACVSCLYVALRVFKTRKLKYQIVIALAAILIGTVVAVFARGPADEIAYIRNSLKALVFSSIFILILLSLEKISRTNMLIAEEKVRRLDTEKMALETELRLLQSQIEPHFLFNSLSNVISLVEDEPQKAKALLGDFVGFLRTSASVRQGRVVKIEQELEFISHYLGVMGTRMGGRLNYTIEAEDDVLSHPIPPLLIQPLVENAVRHGIEPKTGGGSIAVRCKQEGAVIKIEVNDTGAGIDVGKGGDGIGLVNIRKRLELLYGDRAKLIIRENAPSGVSAVIEVPY